MRKYIYLILLLVAITNACNMKAKKETIELTTGEYIEFKSLTKSEFDSIKTDSKYLDDFSNEFAMGVYEMANNSILVEDNDNYSIFYSIDDLRKILSDYSPNGRELLFNKNRFGDEFPDNTSILIEELLSELNIEPQKVDKDLLVIVDNKIKGLEDPLLFQKQHLINIIALIGESVNNKFGSKWEMELADDKQTWNPLLSLNGNNFQFFTFIYEDLYFEEKYSSILLTYESACDLAKQRVKNR